MKKEFVEVCNLSYDDAIESIKNTKEVYFKSGVWNSYELRNTENVIRSIRNSSFGADVRFEKNSQMYYVCTPSNGDMF